MLHIHLLHPHTCYIYIYCTHTCYTYIYCTHTHATHTFTAHTHTRYIYIYCTHTHATHVYMYVHTYICTYACAYIQYIGVSRYMYNMLATCTSVLEHPPCTPQTSSDCCCPSSVQQSCTSLDCFMADTNESLHDRGYRYPS